MTFVNWRLADGQSSIVRGISAQADVNLLHSTDLNRLHDRPTGPWEMSKVGVKFLSSAEQSSKVISKPMMRGLGGFPIENIEETVRFQVAHIDGTNFLNAKLLDRHA